jgi:hypothetical protein
MKKLLIIGVLSGSTLVYFFSKSKTTLSVQDLKPSPVASVVDIQSLPKNFEKIETPSTPNQTIVVEPTTNSSEQTGKTEQTASKVEPTESELVAKH